MSFISKTYFYLIVVISISSNAMGQLPYTFTETAYFETKTVSVATGGDNTIFSAHEHIGLKASIYTGSSFIQTAELYFNGAKVWNVIVDVNGTVFAIVEDRLYALKYTGSSFEIITSILGMCGSIDIDKYGTIFATCNDLYALSYDDTTFSISANVETISRNLAVSPEGTIFIAGSYDGIRAFTYNGVSFKNTAHLDMDGFVTDVAVASNGTVYASTSSGLVAYNYDGKSFSLIASTGASKSLTIGPDNIIFSISDDVKAYRFDGYSFTKLAEVDPYPTATFSFYKVIVGPDSTIFLANGDAGLFAYTFSGYLTTHIENGSTRIPINNELLQNYPNPFNPVTNIKYTIQSPSNVKITLYDLNGHQIQTLVDQHESAGNHLMVFNGSGLASGIYIYTIKTDVFSQSRKMILLK